MFAHAADLGVDVEWAHLGGVRRGEYRDQSRRIILEASLTRAQATATLAHEIGHAVFGDRCSTPRAEKRAWEYGAALIIAPEEYWHAERLVGPHPNALAAELEVTPRLVHAWRDWFSRARLN